MEEEDIFLPKTKQILSYLVCTKKRDIFFWFLTSIIFSSFSVIIEYLVVLFIPRKTFSLASPALEGKILLGAVLMGASSLIYYFEKNEKIKNAIGYSEGNDPKKEKQQFLVPEVIAGLQLFFLIVGCIGVGLLTYLIRTQTIESSIFGNIVMISYIFFIFIALFSLCFRFHFLWKESSFNDFREWDTKTGKYAKRIQKPFDDIKT